MKRRQFFRYAGLLPIEMRSALNYFSEFELLNHLKGKVIEIMKRNPKKNDFYKMFKKGFFALTGTEDINEARSSFLNKKDIIGIKINTNHLQCFTHKALIDVVIDSLLDFGLQKNQIIVWDRFKNIYGLQNVGYNLQNDPSEIRWLTSDTQGMGYDRNHYYYHSCVDEEKKGWYAESEVFWNPQRSYFSKIVTRMVTKIINIPTLKHHSIAGVTLSLKNLSFGATNNTPRFHSGGYLQAIPGIYNTKWLKEKSILHIIDGIKGVFDKGPVDHGSEYTWEEGRLIMSTDPVAGDIYGLSLINKERKRRSLPLIRDSERGLNYLVKAYQNGLGSDSPKVISLRV